MSKPIFLTKEYVDAMVKEFRRSISETKMTDGKITFTKSFDYSGADDTKAFVIFRPVAYIKMLSLLKHFDSEVAWHGVVERIDEDKFVITDIVVYPQEVTGSTVNTDQEEYQKWTMTLDDETYNAMRMQGHSHVNMSTTPSGVDTNHQQQILAQLKGDDYYLFMVFNKRLEHTIKVYDYANNVMYEDKDIIVKVADEGFDNASFIAAADKAVRRKALAAPATLYGDYPVNKRSAYTYGTSEDKENSRPAKKTGKRETAKTKAKSEAKGKSKARYVEDPDYDRYFGGDNAIVDWDQEIFGETRFDT